MRLLGLVLFASLIDFAAVPLAAAQAVPELPESIVVSDDEEPIVVEAIEPALPRFLTAPVPAAELHLTDRAAPEPGRFLNWALGDVRAVGAELTPTRLVVASTFFTLLPALSTQDAGIGRNAPRLRSELSSPFLDVADALGDKKMQFVAGGLFAATLLSDDNHLQDAAYTSFEAAVYASLLSSGMKGLVGRVRPAEDRGPFVFYPFTEHRSFPSGHTTLAFALVTPWVVYYPHPWTFGLYAVSTGTAVSRLSKERHWVTDVVAGAALGTLTGYWLARRHLRQSTPLEVTPHFGPDHRGLTLRYTF